MAWASGRAGERRVASLHNSTTQHGWGSTGLVTLDWPVHEYFGRKSELTPNVCSRPLPSCTICEPKGPLRAGGGSGNLTDMYACDMREDGWMGTLRTNHFAQPSPTAQPVSVTQCWGSTERHIVEHRRLVSRT